MKKILMAAVAFTAITATPALAQSSGTFTVSGSIAGQCGGLGAGLIQFNQIATAANGQVSDNRSLQSTAQNVFCNAGGSTISIEKNNMTNNTVVTDTTNFTNTISYDAAVTIGGTPYSNGAVNILSGNLVVTASNLSSGGKIPVSGAYSGTVVVTLTPGA